MSQFRDTFTKGSRKDSLLSYDDFASRIFMSGFLTCFLVPITIYLIYKNFGKKANGLPANLRLSDCHYDAKGSRSSHCKCSECSKHFSELSHRKTKLGQFFTASEVVKAAILAALWALVFYLVAGINPDDNIKRFDPFDLLGITIGATKREIQKAYRAMSMKYHPDRNPNDPEMAAHFILITKAYKTLTNERSRLNYEKFGNPDGPGMMKIGIGLPRFLIEEGNQIAILSVFFFVLLVVLPGVFVYVYQRQRVYAATGIHVDTLQLICYSITENTRQKALPEVFCCSAECQRIPLKPTDEEKLKDYKEYLPDTGKKRTINSEMFRNMVLFLCYLHRKDEIPTQFASTLREMFKYTILITQTMIDVAVCKGWILTVQSILDFRRGIIQAIPDRREALLQVPHFTYDIIEHVKKGKYGSKSIQEFISQDPKERKGLVNMSERELADINAFCEAYPRVRLEGSVFVTDEEEIFLNDVLTLKLVMTRLHVKEGELLGPAHAPYFPWVKYEDWCITVGYQGEDRMLAFVYWMSRERVITQVVNFTADRPGENVLVCNAMCDSYFGCDVQITIRFSVKVGGRVESRIHPDDLTLDGQVSAIGRMLGELLGEEEEEEEEVEEVE